MNRKAQSPTMPLAILGALAVFIVGFVFINFLLPEVTTFRTDMGCSDMDSLHDGAKLLCLVGGSVVPYAIISVISLAIGIIIARIKI